jgi:prepilin-type N-terminal cleavage/methylation domain-containing protein
MEKLLLNSKAFTLVEVMIALAILLIAARYIFAFQLYEWENNMWTSIGVPYESARFIIGICVLIYFIWRAVSERRKRKQKRLKDTI